MYDDDEIAAFMQRLALTSPADAPGLPSAARLLRQVSWRRRWEGERRMHRTFDVTVPLQIAAGVAAAAVLLVRGLPPLVAMALHAIV
jgi:hypothetical protein